jgi:hypothetical protein
LIDFSASSISLRRVRPVAGYGGRDIVNKISESLDVVRVLLKADVERRSGGLKIREHSIDFLELLRGFALGSACGKSNS